MTDANKERLKQLGWGKAQGGAGVHGRKLRQATELKTKAEVRLLRLEKELVDVRRWMERLGDRYRERGYDARSIDKMVARIKEVLK
jgi:hypothetical protein